MASLDKTKNFAIAVVAQGYDAAAVTINLSSGHGNLFPTPPFNAVWWNATTYANPALDPNREIVRVTSKNVDQLTITRGQETSDGGLTASAKNSAGAVYRLAQILTSKMITDIEAKSVDIGLIRFVSEFGAKGDGTTDDTAAIQSAIDAGNEIFIPPGTYLVDGGLAPKTDLTIRGSGPGATVIKLKNSAGQAAIFKGTGALESITIRDLTLNGNESNNSGNGDGISIDQVDGLLIDNVEIVDCRLNGIALGDSASGGEIANALIRGCRIGDCHGDLIRIYNKDNTNRGNKILGCSLFEPGFSEATGVLYGINVYGPILIADVSIRTVHDQTVGIILQDDDVTNGLGANGAQVSNCLIKGTADASDISKGVVVDALRVHLTNIEVEGCDYGFQVTGDECVLKSCTGITADSGFYVSGDRTKIMGCYTSGATTGIRIDSGAADTTIANCHIAAGTTKVDNQSTTTHARKNTGWITEAIVETANIDNTSGSNTWQGSATVAHGLDVTPTKQQCNVSIYFVEGEPTTPMSFRGPFVTVVDATNVGLRLYAIAGGTGSFNLRIVAHINALP